MTSPPSRPSASGLDGVRLPRWLRWFGLPALGVLLTLFFVVQGFPFDVYRGKLVGAVGAATGAEVRVDHLGTHLGLAGLSLEAIPLQLTWPGGLGLEFERARVRPAWSLAWLWGQPALHVTLEGESGNAAGTLIVGDNPAWDGAIHDVDLSLLPLEELLGGTALEGRADADVDLQLGAEGARGSVEIQAREGSVSLPEVPLGLPYDTLDGSLRFEEGALMVVEALDLVGPMVVAHLEGRVGDAPVLDRAPLQLDLDVTIADSNLRSVAAPMGLRLDREGSGQIQVRGTVGAPRLR